MEEYLVVLDDAAFGAAKKVTPKFISPADPAARWTGGADDFKGGYSVMQEWRYISRKLADFLLQGFAFFRVAIFLRVGIHKVFAHI